MKFMEYPIEKAFQAIESQGVEKTIAMIKLALKEMPRLEAAFMNPETQKEAKNEIRLLMKAIGTEMDDLIENGMPAKELQTAIYNPKNYTPEEWASLNRFFQLLRQLSPLIFKDDPKVKKLKWVYPKA